MKNPRISLSALFPSIIDMAKAKKEGFPCLDIQQFFTFNFGTFQAFIDYQENDYVVKYRGFNHSDYASSWQTYITTPYQKKAISAFTSLCLDYLDPIPFKEPQDVLLSQIQG